MQRKVPLVSGEYYHVFTRSISRLIVFNSDHEYKRVLNLFRFYQIKDVTVKFSLLEKNLLTDEQYIDGFLLLNPNQEKLVQIVAYCLMPTHIHLVLRQLADQGISLFMGNVLNSYTRYFNLRHERKGPLWEGKFKNVLVRTDEQLNHLVRYVHLNPATAGIVNDPEQWSYSSYGEYLETRKNFRSISNSDGLFDMDPQNYRKFVLDQLSYQKEIASIRHLILD